MFWLHLARTRCCRRLCKMRPGIPFGLGVMLARAPLGCLRGPASAGLEVLLGLSPKPESRSSKASAFEGVAEEALL